MRKHMVFALFLIVSCLLLSSCGLPERFALDGDLSGAVELSVDEEGEYVAIYQDAMYHKFNLRFQVTKYDSVAEAEDVLLGWNGWRFGYVDLYYSDTTEKPLFIYETRLRRLYFREDYDYHEDMFTIDGTDISFRFSNAFEETDQYSRRRGQKLLIRSETNSRIALELEIITDNGPWYAVTLDGDILELSDEFESLLKDNNILSEFSDQSALSDQSAVS